MKTRTAAVTLVVALLWHLVIGDDSDVRCLWNTSCLLEANFSIGDDVAIYWIQFPEILVHSFSFEADQLKKQDKRFRGRTSLFKENIGKGNASLLLKDVVVEDEGRYMCRVGTLMGISASFVNLHIEAPVTQIHIHCDGRRLICSSDRIFPRPELRWSTVPALPHGFINTSEVRQETHTKLYNISGSLDLAGDALPDMEYVCDVISSRSGSRVTWKKTNGSNVRCRWNTSCLLEANFSIGDDVAIYWIQFPEILVHSFSFEADQLKKQHKRFRGRTSLFKENIGKGNASLLLKDVVVGDEGRYMCRVGTLMGISASFVNLHIEAPVTQIQIHCDGRRLICSSDRIFPRPELRWSTVPALPHGFINTSEVCNETHTKLYNISGWLDLAGDTLPDVEYVCDVTSSRSGGRVTWKKTIVNVSHAETSIECASVSDQTSVVWTFNRNHVIASKRAGHKLDIAEHWRKHVKGLSEAGSLHLQALTGHQSGTYTCTLSNATRTRVHDVFLTVTGTEDVGTDEVGVVLAVLGVLLSVAAVWVFSLFKDERRKKEDESTVSPRAK